MGIVLWGRKTNGLTDPYSIDHLKNEWLRVHFCSNVSVHVFAVLSTCSVGQGQWAGLAGHTCASSPLKVQSERVAHLWLGH